MSESATATAPVFKFHPVANPRPRRLTGDQIDDFNRFGYLRGISIFNPSEAERNRSDFDRLMALFVANGKGSYDINGYHTTCASIHRLVVTPGILDHVEDLLGPDFVCWGTHYFCKQPGDGRAVSWHQDAPYWPLTPGKTVTVWLAIDDADEENSAMRVIPGSHLHGAFSTRTSSAAENNVLNTTVDGVERFGSPVFLDLLAGQISMHSDLLLHGSLPNQSTRRRCGLTMRFASVDVRSTAGWNHNAILCRGSDPSGHWQGPPLPPAGDTPFGHHQRIGAN